MDNIQHKNLQPQVYNLKGWMKLVDENQLYQLFSNQLKESGFSILNYSSHQFPVNGFTAFWLLAESHLALHTFTESGWCYIELTSCNKDKSADFKLLTEQLEYEVKWDNDIDTSMAISKNITNLKTVTL